VAAADPQYLKELMLSRGLPEHIADAFLMNFADESGFRPGINEIEPLVPGSRGGYGLYQATGGRRRAYEAFAAERGAALDDPEAQIDFMMYELQGPESRAAESILSAPDTRSAAVAIARDFLRPAPENLERRVAKYSGMTEGYERGTRLSGSTPLSYGSAGVAEDPAATERDRMDAVMTGYEMMTEGSPEYCPAGYIYDMVSGSCVPIDVVRSSPRPKPAPERGAALQRFGLPSLA
jgi:hypothetical protein